MSKVLTFKCSVNEDLLQKVLDDICNDEAAMTEIHDVFAKTIDPWTPFLEGNLHTQLEITDKYVKYTVPYAHYQYYGVDFNHTITYHPLASAKWDEVAMQTKRNDFERDVENILKRRLREKNGD